MFETFAPPDAAARLRSAAVPPFAAFLLAQGYLTFYPFLASVPAWLFWSVDAILLAGTAAGVVQLVRIVRSERIRGVAIGWLVAEAAATLLSGRIFLALTFPWL